MCVCGSRTEQITGAGDVFVKQVRAVMGPCAYMLTAVEELWEKQMPGQAEELLMCV